MIKAESINELVALMRNEWGDNAPEAFAGLLSTVINDNQFYALIEHLRKGDKNIK